ncbi:SCO family protein [Deinococcus yavapaiensis]|uniref:SCO family protein n=1 Tax=Deinococcus yavapaiensis TaxID=309889 RepID=UPI000DA14671|nr:SCO family protein [Deinococcus yavapaiensis]
MNTASTGDAPKLDVATSLTRALLAVALLLSLVWVYARLQNPFPYFGTPYEGRPVAATFTATDQDGRAFDFASTRGQVVALFFGFTHCPNICPLTLSYLERARQQLPADVRDDVRVVFVTLDPERDKPALIKQYVDYFGKDVTGLYIPAGDLKAVANDYQVRYAKAPVEGTSNYFINHTTATYVIDRTGRLRVKYDYTQMPQVDKVVNDLREVLKR